MNDRWPLPAADGVSGPFLKMKKANGKPCLPVQDSTNSCFDKLVHLDAKGFDRAPMQGTTGIGIPRDYESTYPYGRGATFEDVTIVLIVKGTEARLYYPTPMTDRFTEWGNLRQAQTMTSVWTFDLQGYTGGQVSFLNLNLNFFLNKIVHNHSRSGSLRMRTKRRSRIGRSRI